MRDKATAKCHRRNKFVVLLGETATKPERPLVSAYSCYSTAGLASWQILYQQTSWKAQDYNALRNLYSIKMGFRKVLRRFLRLKYLISTYGKSISNIIDVGTVLRPCTYDLLSWWVVSSITCVRPPNHCRAECDCQCMVIHSTSRRQGHPVNSPSITPSQP